MFNAHLIDTLYPRTSGEALMRYRMKKAQLEQAAINRPDWDMNDVYDRTRIAGRDGVWGVQQPTQGAVAHRASDLLGARSGDSPKR